MGTRSNTLVIETGHKSDIVLANIYRQFDGYPSGHGLALAEFILPIKVVNGISDMKANVANGAGCFAAQLVAHLKTGPGNIYLEDPNQVEFDHDFTYKIRIDTYQPSKGIRIEVFEGGAKVFKGAPGAFLDFCKAPEDDSYEVPL